VYIYTCTHTTHTYIADEQIEFVEVAVDQAVAPQAHNDLHQLVEDLSESGRVSSCPTTLQSMHMQHTHTHTHTPDQRARYP
jgi:hypothetical protein